MIPLFIPCPSGQLFCGFYPPVTSGVGLNIIHVSAFAEEMNKSRRMVALQAQAFADQGCSVLVLDLFGTGDGSGDFGEATWEIWLQNIDSAITWLMQNGAQSIILWGLRTGVLLAMDFASHSLYPIKGLIAWQPVVNGDIFLTQFLRLRVAASIMDSNVPKEKTSDLKQQLLAGQAIEVSGYCLNPELAKPILALRADHLLCPSVKEMAIFGVVSSADTPGAIANTQLLTFLQEQNINASVTNIVGDNFWDSQEISEAADLIPASCDKLGQWQFALP